MAYEYHKPKSGMEGRTTRTSRWGTRVEVKEASKFHRRQEDKQEVKEQLEDSEVDET